MTAPKSAPSVLFTATEKAPPVLPVCEHIAGNEKFIRKAFQLQSGGGVVFDVTCDLEDGAPVGDEIQHALRVAQLIASPENVRERAGARIHDPSHPSWKRDVETLLSTAGKRIQYLTIPKPASLEDVIEVSCFIQEQARTLGLGRSIPLHVLIETHGALRDVWSIAALPDVEVLDFGLLDFISGHHGAIPETCMESPGQFDHALLRRAKAEIVAAALANGVVPAHNITVDISSAARVEADARRAHSEFGFLRMWSIHPQQIEPIVRAMTPTHSQVAHAEAILLAASRAAWGPIRYADKLYDRASFRFYWHLLERVRVNGGVVSPEIEALLD